MAADMAAIHRGTPLYGQPSWWGDGDADDENSFKQETKTSSRKHEGSAPDGKEGRGVEQPRVDGLEPSYFEIPTKEGKMADNGIHEIPTKDTEGVANATASPASNASAAAQGHASFTIEFDAASPGKVTIKDHVSKVAPDLRPRARRAGQPEGRELSTLQAAMMASESKVADWLAHNDPTLVRRESTEEDSKSIQSDVPVHLKRLKGSKHEDGTQSDSENGPGLRFGNRRLALEERLRAGPRASRTAFMIEFYDEENPRKRRSYSFSQTAPLLGGVAGEGLCPTPPSHPKTTSSGANAPTTTITAAPADGPKSGVTISPAIVAGAPTAARVLLKQRSEDPSVGRSSVSTGHPTTSPTSPTSPPSPSEGTPRGAGERAAEQEDDHSDKGTYTIELENPNPEEEEARRMIDTVFGVEQNQNQTQTRSR